MKFLLFISFIAIIFIVCLSALLFLNVENTAEDKTYLLSLMLIKIPAFIGLFVSYKILYKYYKK